MFSESGFDRPTIRGIATWAGVDPALVHHHFGAKQQLFVAAHQLPVDLAAMFDALSRVPEDQRAEQMVRLYPSTFGAPESPALSLLRAATTNQRAARMLREYLEQVLLSRADTLFDRPDARLRVALAASHMISVFARSLRYRDPRSRQDRY